MAGGGEGVALVDVHHPLRGQVVFDVVDEPVGVDLHVVGTMDDLLSDGTGLFVFDLVHIGHDAAEGQLHNLEAVLLAQDLRVADEALNAEPMLRQ